MGRAQVEREHIAAASSFELMSDGRPWADAMGDLAQPSSFRSAAIAADGAIHTAFAHSIDFLAAVEEERRAIASLIQAYAGADKRLVVSTATGVVGDTDPEPIDESFPGQLEFPTRVRMAVEEDVKEAGQSGVRGVVV